jgi:hypothetical protein
LTADRARFSIRYVDSKMKKHIHKIKKDLKELHAQPHRHWHYVYMHRRRRLGDGINTKEIIAGQIFTVIASVGAGLVLDIKKENIGLLVGAYLMMPGIVDLVSSL